MRACVRACVRARWLGWQDTVELYPANGGGTPPESRFVGFIGNQGAGKLLDEMQAEMSNHDIVMSILNKHSSLKVVLQSSWVKVASISTTSSY